MNHRPPRCLQFQHHLPLRYALCVLGIAALAAGMFTSPVRADALIAVAGPPSGPNAPITDAIATGAREAAARINASGGINGERLSIEIVTDGCEATPAAKLAADLSARKVALVLGHPCAPAAIAAAKVYAAHSTLFLATATRHPALTSPRAGPVIFRLAGRVDKQGKDAGRYLAHTFSGKTIAVVHDRTNYAKTIAEAAEAVLTKAGMTPITATLIAGEKDFPLVTAKIKNAAAIFYAGFPLEAGLLHQQLRAAGSTAVMLLSDSNATREFAGTFGRTANGVQVMLARTALISDETDQDPAIRSRAAHRQLAATAVERFAAAANAVKTNESKKIAEWLASSGIASPLGPIAFDASGDAQRASFDVHTWIESTENGIDSGRVWERAHISPPYR